MIGLSSSPGSAGGVRDLSYAAHENRALFHDVLIEFVIIFVRRAHVDVEIVDGRTGAFFDKMGGPGTLHAADDRAVVVVVAVAAADA